MLKHNLLKRITYSLSNEESSLFFEPKKHRVIDSVCVSEIGRSEAVHISPNLKKIAYSSFDSNRILIFDVCCDDRDLSILRFAFAGSELKSPHDFAWINDQLIVVANRHGPAMIVSVQDGDNQSETVAIIEEMSNSNSVSLVRKDGLLRLFFCRTNNCVDYCDLDDYWNVRSLGTQIDGKFLSVPDGVATSPSGSKIVVTSALDDRIVVCDLRNEDIFDLGITKRPHSVDFLTEDLILSTSGNDPFVTCWSISSLSKKFQFRALRGDQYALRHSETEGGVKGVCCSPELGMVFLTCPNAPFLIFDSRFIT